MIAVLPPPRLTCRDLTVDLGQRRILERVSFSVRAGEFLGIIGPNGGGKTTLLRALLGALPPAAGEVHWGDDPARRPQVGYVPQRLLTDRSCPLSARAVVEQGAGDLLPRWGQRRRQRAARAEELLGRVGLRRQAEVAFVDLSAGQQRRLLLARALMREPEVLLLDEPTAGVDTEGQEQFCAILSGLAQRGVTVLLVSHDVPLVTAHADRIACVAVTLHWHGAAEELDQTIVSAAYRCELERYRTACHVHAPSRSLL